MCFTYKKKLLVAKITICVLGISCLAYGLILLAIIGPGSWFNFVFAGMGLFLVAFALLLGPIVGLLSKCNKVVLAVILSVICMLLLNFVLFEGTVIAAANRRIDTDNDAPKYIIVLGAKVEEGGRPSLEFSKRLIKAEELCTEKSTLILTGGKGLDEPVSEALGAYNYLNERGRVSCKEILLETESTSTSENLKNALEIIRADGGDSDDSVLIISSAFHLFRASKLALYSGFSNTSYAGSVGLEILQPYYYFREYAAYFRELVL